LGYVSWARMKISEAKFRITQKPKTLSQTVTITGNATTPKGKTFTFKDERAVVSGNYVITKPMLANRHLATRQTQFFNPMTIDWTVKYKKGSLPKTKTLGSSKHTVYVTLNKPYTPEFDTLYLTSLHLAVSNQGAKGKMGEAKKQALKKTWKLFETQKITNWDNKPLYYYKSGHGFKDLACDDLSALLTMGKGQCDTFEKLFRATLSANGISSEQVVISTKESYVDNVWGMGLRGHLQALSKNWTFKTPSLSDTGAYKWRLILKDEGDSVDGMVPANKNNNYADLISEEGVAGQNSPTPSEKTFGQHFIVKITDSQAIEDGKLTTLYYDPSYGVAYKGNKEEAERDFEDNAVDGYFRQFKDKDLEVDADPDSETGYIEAPIYRARKKLGEIGIEFDR